MRPIGCHNIVGEFALISLKDESGWNKVLSFAVPDEAVKMLIVDSATEKVLGATAEELSGKTLRELGFMPNEYRKYGNGFHVSIDDETYYGVFYEYDGVLYGRFKSQGVIYQPLHAPTVMMPLVVTVFLLILGIGIGTVKSRLNRAKAELKKILTERNFFA